ncbi:MAG: hypothetical protein ACTSRI_11800 [Promethearchaeota archaeon]
MGTIKFDRQNELDEIIARIYLDTNKKFTKKALIEIIFELGIQDYHALLNKIKNKDRTDTKDLRNKFIHIFSGSLSVSNPDDINPKSIWEKHLVD